MNATASGALLPARLQKASLDDKGLVLEVFAGARRFLVLEAGAVTVVDARPAGDPDRKPPANQGLLRKELVPSMLTEWQGQDGADPAGSSSAAPVAHLVFVRLDEKIRHLAVERTASDPRVVLLARTDDGLRILAVVLGAPRALDGRDLRRGQLYAEPIGGGEPGARADAARAARAPAAPRVVDPLAALRAQLKAEHKRVRRLVDALERDLVRHGDPAVHERDGELLKTVLGQLRRGMTQVDVTDFDGAPRVIALDEKRDAKGNLTQLFARAKRARTALSRTEPRLAEARSTLARLDEARALLAGAHVNAASAQAATALVDSTRAAAPPRRRVAREGKRKAWRAFRVSGDVVVRVGRGAKDNDALVRDARGNDLWLHARERHGAHVVVPSRGDELPEELVLDAAHLAAHFSSARGETRVEVQTTRVKHLRKPGPGAPAGLVHVTEEKVIVLRVDEVRLQRLLMNEVAA